MYSIKQGLTIGFHGCDQSIVDLIVSQNTTDLKISENAWDWLGNGIYFWENNYDRALEWAKHESKKKDSKIKKPAVLGAVISLGNSLDLLDSKNIILVEEAFNLLKLYSQLTDIELPKNRNPINVKGNDNLLRNLDCAVIETVCSNTEKMKFDSVRGMFIEGKPLYENAGFYEKSHIQIAIRNPNCIKGYFVPKSLNADFGIV